MWPSARLQPPPFFSLAIALVLGAVHVNPPAGPRVPTATVDDVKALVKSRYFEAVDDRRLEYDALRGLLGGLDPNSAFFSPEEARDFREETEGHFGGLGMEISVERGSVTVIAPLEDTPAFAAGILPGDKIVAIDGEPREFASAEEAARVLRGPPGTIVRLSVLHEGEKIPEEISITRREIDVKSVRQAAPIEDDPEIGHVRISQFRPRTAADLRKAVEDLLARGMRALVLDLRSNPGGHLDEAVEVADLFVEKGLIVRVVGRDGRTVSERAAKKEGTLPWFPLAVLVNGYTASAAEVVAGCLEDLGRATCVGTRTFGKGSVQSVIPLDDGSILKLTVARYFTASGRSIHREPGAGAGATWGIEPNLRVELDPRTLATIYRKRAAVAFRGAPLPRGGEPHDVQLDAAVELLRAKLGR